MPRSITLLLTATLIFPSFAHAQAAPASPWQLIARSHEVNYQIHCYQGKTEVYGVHDQPGISDWHVARDIWFYPLPDGRTALHFLHGFTSATKQATYVAATGVSCEMNEA